MKYFIAQEYNPARHPDMPMGYPWCLVDFDPSDGRIQAMSEEDYLLFINSFDLSNYENSLVREKKVDRQRNQRLWGNQFADQVIDEMGVTNLELVEQGVSINNSQLMSNLGMIQDLLRAGSLKQARSLAQYLKPNFISYAKVFDFLISGISNYLKDTGYENDL